MDATAYHKAVAEAKRALERSLALSLVLTLAGLALFAVLRRRLHRVAALQLDKEREQRL
jgi:hypothetical protein